MKREKHNELIYFARNIDLASIVQKLTLNQNLSPDEATFILSFALILARDYSKDRRRTSHLEFGYYLILKYSVIHQDYRPLYDFSVNFGFYPIAKSIFTSNLLNDTSLQDILADIGVNTFKRDGYIETIEQRRIRNQVLSSEYSDIALIAPTSFGKSELIVDMIQSGPTKHKRVCIIVPTKSLLSEVTRSMRKKIKDRKILTHEEMYGDEPEFLAIFTQERALRFLEKHDQQFDTVFVDEAHNLLGDGSRSILLARLLKRCRHINPTVQYVYLSPLIDDAANLALVGGQIIQEKRIRFSVKEPEILELQLDNRLRQYNRFLDMFYQMDNAYGLFEYLRNNATEKNFIYLYTPRKIESFSRELVSNLDTINSDRLTQLILALKEYVHEEFFLVECLTKGVIYLHGKLPDIVKEYVEDKFKSLPEISYVVANTVILEGVNLPINSLFVLSTSNLDAKQLTNLIGRVNRLNYVFQTTPFRVERLQPKVHFLNSEIYNRKSSNMANKIQLLKSGRIADEVCNPLLQSYVEPRSSKESKRAEKNKKVVLEEVFLGSEAMSRSDELKRYFIEKGLSDFYANLDQAIEIISQKLTVGGSSPEGTNAIDSIYWYLFEGIDGIDDSEIHRLRFSETRAYYKREIEEMHRSSLSERIGSTVRYFQGRALSSDALFYVGSQFGEVSRSSDTYTEKTRPVYIDLAKKSHKDLVNIAVIKLKIEDDFISFKLNKCINFMFDYELITVEEYNLLVYGNTNSDLVNLTRLGLSGYMIRRLNLDGQLNNVSTDATNNLVGNDQFNLYKQSVDDFFRFQLDRVIL